MEANKSMDTVLAKLGVELPEKMSNERKMKKLEHRLEKTGAPADLSKEERDWLTELGLPTEPKTTDNGNDDTPADDKAPKSKKSDKGKKATAPKGKADKKDKPEKTAKPRLGVLGAFREAFAKKTTILRSDLRAKMTEKFGDALNNGTFNNYVWKAGKKGKDNNCGITLKQEKNKDGKNVLVKIA